MDVYWRALNLFSQNDEKQIKTHKKRTHQVERNFKKSARQPLNTTISIRDAYGIPSHVRADTHLLQEANAMQSFRAE